MSRAPQKDPSDHPENNQPETTNEHKTYRDLLQAEIATRHLPDNSPSCLGSGYWIRELHQIERVVDLRLLYEFYRRTSNCESFDELTKHIWDFICDYALKIPSDADDYSELLSTSSPSDRQYIFETSDIPIRIAIRTGIMFLLEHLPDIQGINGRKWHITNRFLEYPLKHNIPISPEIYTCEKEVPYSSDLVH